MEHIRCRLGTCAFWNSASDFLQRITELVFNYALPVYGMDVRYRNLADDSDFANRSADMDLYRWIILLHRCCGVFPK